MTSIVPYQTFPTKDGTYIMVGAGNDGQFKIFSTAIGHPEWAQDEQYKTNAGRVKNRIALVAHITEALQERTTVEWLAVFKGVSFAFAPISKHSNIRCLSASDE